MNIQDPLSNMFTVIRNAQFVKKKSVTVYYSKFKLAIVKILKNEGYIKNYKVIINSNFFLKIFLKYYNNKPVIEKIKRISLPSLRVYKKSKFIPKVMGGLGVIIISTSIGLISDRLARKLGVGGELMFYVF